MENRNPPVFIIILVLFVVGVRTFAPRFFDRSIVRGESFSAKIPEGWHVKKEQNEVTLTSAEKDLVTDMPVAIFSIYAQKQKGALFMEDFFPEVLDALQKENGEILSTGEQLIDGQSARWVLFRYNKPDIATVTLYIIDDYNRLTRIQYVGMIAKFEQYGEVFDEFKKSIKLKGAM